jgi:hypothetical protein
VAQQVSLEFSGVSSEMYWAVNQALGVDMKDPATWPAGMLSHRAGRIGEDGWMVTEVWESQDAQGAFMGGQLGAALAQVQVPPPDRVTWADLEVDVTA